MIVTSGFIVSGDGRISGKGAELRIFPGIAFAPGPEIAFPVCLKLRKIV